MFCFWLRPSFHLCITYSIDFLYVYKIVNNKLRRARKTGVGYNEIILVTKVDPSFDSLYVTSTRKLSRVRIVYLCSQSTLFIYNILFIFSVVGEDDDECGILSILQSIQFFVVCLVYVDNIESKEIWNFCSKHSNFLSHID